MNLGGEQDACPMPDSALSYQQSVSVSLTTASGVQIVPRFSNTLVLHNYRSQNWFGWQLFGV